MIDYTGIPCPVCGKEFTSQDDIVVCPECGAPYHRECYLKEGHCVYADAHGTDGAWKPPHSHQEDNPSEQPEDTQRVKPCPRCGVKNYKDALFCDKCGLPLTSNEARPGGYPFPGQQGQPPMGGPVPFVFDPLGGVNPNEDFDGAAASDVAKYVGPNAPYFLPVFKRVKSTGKGKFNFSAFLFTGGWMLYRKQYKYGILITLLLVALTVASLMTQLFVWEPLLETLPNLNLSTATPIDYIPAMLDKISDLGFWEQLPYYIPFITTIFSWSLRFFVGFQGNRLYYHHCVSQVKKINAMSAPEETRLKSLQTSGGVNIPLAICLLVSYMIISYLPLFL